jgi:hypothetical protein
MSKISSGSFFLGWVAAVTIILTLAVLVSFLFVWSVADPVEDAIGGTAAALIMRGFIGAAIAGGAGLVWLSKGRESALAG